MQERWKEKEKEGRERLGMRDVKRKEQEGGMSDKSDEKVRKEGQIRRR